MARKRKQHPHDPTQPYIVKCRCNVCKKKWVVGERVNMPLIDAIKAGFKRHRNCIEKGMRYSYERKI